MFALIICLFISFFVCVASFLDEEDGVVEQRILILTGILFIISQYLLFKSHDFKLSTPMQINTDKEYIYSLNNGSDKIYGSFILGSGTIGSTAQYSYFIQNSDGSKQKKSIQADGTKIYEDVVDKPYIEIITCQDGEHYSFLKGYFEEAEEEKCQKSTERKIFVPKNTIILEYNVK